MFKTKRENLFDELLMDPILPMGSQTKGLDVMALNASSIIWIDVQVAVEFKTTKLLR